MKLYLRQIFRRCIFNTICSYSFGAYSMPLSVSYAVSANTSHQQSQITSPHSTNRKCTPIRLSLKVIACALLLTASSAVIADTQFGFGISDGDRKLTWLKNDVSVSEEVAARFDNSRNAKEEEISDIDYEAYLKTFKLYMVFKRSF